LPITFGHIFIYVSTHYVDCLSFVGQTVKL
jgi:hypothetical protein